MLHTKFKHILFVLSSKNNLGVILIPTKITNLQIKVLPTVLPQH